MKQVALKRTSAVALCIMMSAVPAVADERSPFQVRDLELTVAGAALGEVRSLGRLDAIVEALGHGEHAYKVDTYERGVTIMCTRPGRTQSADDTRIVLDLEFQPTRAPELAHIVGIRVNEAELPESAHSRTLDDLVRGR